MSRRPPREPREPREPRDAASASPGRRVSRGLPRQPNRRHRHAPPSDFEGRRRSRQPSGQARDVPSRGRRRGRWQSGTTRPPPPRQSRRPPGRRENPATVRGRSGSLRADGTAWTPADTPAVYAPMPQFESEPRPPQRSAPEREVAPACAGRYHRGDSGTAQRQRPKLIRLPRPWPRSPEPRFEPRPPAHVPAARVVPDLPPVTLTSAARFGARAGRDQPSCGNGALGRQRGVVGSAPGAPPRVQSSRSRCRSSKRARRCRRLRPERCDQAIRTEAGFGPPPFFQVVRTQPAVLRTDLMAPDEDRLLIVCHTQFGGTEQMAEAAARGAGRSTTSRRS